MTRRKDRERYLRNKEANPDYLGFRGGDQTPVQDQPVLETVVCSVCQRKRNVASEILPADRSSYVCLSCQEEKAGIPASE